MKKLTALLALGAVVAFMPSVSKASIVGSEHDFTSETGGAGSITNQGIASFTWSGGGGTYQNPCQVCHIPHKAQDPTVSMAPLWNHAPSANASSYVKYGDGPNASPTFKALGLSVTLGSSVACLSCHDGSVAVNEMAGYTGKVSTNGNAGAASAIPSWAVEAIGGTDLTKMHPIGVSYTAAAAVDVDLVQTPTALMNRMLKGTQKTVECASCHDIHRTMGVATTYSHNLIVSLDGGALCTTCHSK